MMRKHVWLAMACVSASVAFPVVASAATDTVKVTAGGVSMPPYIVRGFELGSLGSVSPSSTGNGHQYIDI